MTAQFVGRHTKDEVFKETGVIVPYEMDIDFAAGGNGRLFMGAGWSTAEETETWSDGATASLTVPRPAAPATYVLVLTSRPHVAVGGLAAQRLNVNVNGVEVGRFALPRRSTRACRIAWPIITRREAMEITFDLPDAARPADLGYSSDRRQLGAAFSRVRIYADVHDPSPLDGGDADADPVPIDIDRILLADRISQRDLMVRFESLGQNCEFGLVQRACQAEPLGLLRFSSTPLPKLLTALEARFQGMGSPDSLEVQISANGRELMVQDSQFGFLYHAFVDAGAMEPEAVRRREVKRLPFLVRKLLEDLTSGEKIFVFKGMGALEEEEVYPLAQALRRYGPTTLLFITLADARHAPGTVESRAPGFFVGYLSRFAPTEAASDFVLSEWVRVCRGAYRLQLAGVAAIK